MSRILTPLLLGAAAFGIAWWAGSFPPPSESDQNFPADSAAIMSTNPAPQRPAPELSALAKRSAQLQRTENPALSDLPALLTETGLDSSESLRMAGIWAEKDPAGMWKWLQEGGREKLYGVDPTYHIFASWFRLDPEAAMANMRAAGSPSNAFAAKGILTNLTTTDSSVREKLLTYLDEIVEAWTLRLDFSIKPAERATVLADLPEGKARTTLTLELGKFWIEKDWRSATAWAATLPEPLRTKTMTRMAESAFGSTPKRVVASDPLPSHSEAECFAWAGKWISSEATPEIKNRMGTAFVRKLAETDPSAALEWAQANLSAQPLTVAMGTILKEKAAKDPAAARQLVEALPPGARKNRVAFEVTGEPSTESASWLLKVAGTEANLEWLGYASDWSHRNPAAYRAFLEAEAGSKLPSGLAEGGLRNLAAIDGLGTMEWAVRTQPPDSVRNVLFHWAGLEPSAAIDWVLQRPPGAERNEAMEYVRFLLTYSRIPDAERAPLLGRLGNQ
ncbi:MAG: hypothetical protein JWL81_2562 [Verrucomicrobiales bacterium]|nr:hypothetical protein [Verrucomicrobiales bacterium]